MNYAAARHNMVENQIRTNRVTDPQVLDALEQIPREVFVPTPLRGIAYLDDDIDLGGGRVLIEPAVFARLLQAAAVQPTDVVLDIGAGSGYSTAVLSRLASTVVAVESDSDLAARAASLLNELAVDNAAVVTSPLAAGDPAHGPYDVILLEGAVSHIPETLNRQLSEGGRLVAVVVDASGLGRATLTLRQGQQFSSLVLFDAQLPVLPGFQRQPCFAF